MASEGTRGADTPAYPELLTTQGRDEEKEEEVEVAPRNRVPEVSPLTAEVQWGLGSEGDLDDEPTTFEESG